MKRERGVMRESQMSLSKRSHKAQGEHMKRGWEVSWGQDGTRQEAREGGVMRREG